MTHTPGPWVVFAGPEGFDVLPAMRSGRIAGPIDSGHDADLIAAAPDMLAALKAVQHDMRHHLRDNRVRTALIRKGALELVAAAIEKAEAQPLTSPKGSDAS